MALCLLLYNLFCCALWHWSCSHTCTYPGPSCPIPITLLWLFTVKTRRQKKNSLNTLSIWLVWYFLFNRNEHRHTGSNSIMFKICRIWQSQVSKVSTVTMLQAGLYGVQILVEARVLPIFQNIQTRSGTNLPPIQGYWGLFPWGNVAGA